MFFLGSACKAPCAGKQQQHGPRMLAGTPGGPRRDSQGKVPEREAERQGSDPIRPAGPGRTLISTLRGLGFGTAETSPDVFHSSLQFLPRGGQEGPLGGRGDPPGWR